jgi:hypothetical protein
MQGQRFTVAFTAINVVALLLALMHLPHTTVEPTPLVLRGRALELVDDRGQVRSRLTVEPSGEVVLRLLDKNGTIRVKLGASEDGSGLVLLDEATEPAIQALARRTRTPDKPVTTSLTLRGAAGPPRVISP